LGEKGKQRERERILPVSLLKEGKDNECTKK